MNSIKIDAPAKVNLYLKVLKKRRDSYHNILILFERISVYDTILITRAGRGISVSSDLFITSDEKDNIVYKAARMMIDRYLPGVGVKIEITKRIPIAAGLGGGSSDAASVLIGINRLFGLNIPDKNMMSMASKLGSDVPFFLLRRPYAIARSRGERLSLVKGPKELWHLLVNPGFGVSTKDIYLAHDKAKKVVSRGLTTKRLNDTIQAPLKDSLDLAALECMLHNDLEQIVVAKKKAIGKVIQRLASTLGKKAIVSGSGPSVFCLYRTKKEAIEAKEMLLSGVPARNRKGWRIFVAKTAY